MLLMRREDSCSPFLIPGSLITLIERYKQLLLLFPIRQKLQLPYLAAQWVTMIYLSNHYRFLFILFPLMYYPFHGHILDVKEGSIEAKVVSLARCDALNSTVVNCLMEKNGRGQSKHKVQISTGTC